MIDLIVEEQKWPELDGFEDWTGQLDDMLQSTLESQNIQHASVSLLLTNSEDIQSLNWKFRDIDRSTNVLSFPQYEPGEKIQNGVYIDDHTITLMDIQSESEKYHMQFFNRCSHLFVHGVLHLCGLDHVDEDERLQMEAFEVEVLKKFGINDPYMEGC